MKKKNLLKKAIFLVLMTFAAVLFFSKILPIIIFSYGSTWQFNAEFKEHSEAFLTVKDFIAAQYPDEDEKWVSVSYTKDHEIRIYDPEISDYIDLPEDVATALKEVAQEGFRQKAGFDVIRIRGNRISFCIEAAPYALVYSPDKRPTYLNSPDEQFRVKVKKIKKGWYHVVQNPGFF